MLVDLGQQLGAGLGQAAFGIPHRGGIVAVERTEIAGAVHERIAEREGLGHADQRFIERRVAVRVVAPHHVADDFCAFAEPGVGRQVLLPHRVQNAALNGLEAVPHIRQRTGRNDRERVVEVSSLCRFVEGDRVTVAPGRGCRERVNLAGTYLVEQGRGAGLTATLGQYRHLQSYPSTFPSTRAVGVRLSGRIPRPQSAHGSRGGRPIT